MASQKPKKRGRKPLPPAQRRSNTLAFRVRDDVYQLIQKNAEAAGRPVNTQAQFHLEQDLQMAEAMGGRVDEGDVKDFATWVAELQAALIEAGETADTWRGYASEVPFMKDAPTPDALDELHDQAFSAVNRTLEKARAFCQANGEPPSSTEAPKFPSGTPREVKQEIMMQGALHRFHYRKIAEIESNRARNDMRRLLADPDFKRAYHDAGHADHYKAVEKMRGDQRIIEQHDLKLRALGLANTEE